MTSKQNQNQNQDRNSRRPSSLSRRPSQVRFAEQAQVLSYSAPPVIREATSESDFYLNRDADYYENHDNSVESARDRRESEETLNAGNESVNRVAAPVQQQASPQVPAQAYQYTSPKAGNHGQFAGHRPSIRTRPGSQFVPYQQPSRPRPRPLPRPHRQPVAPKPQGLFGRVADAFNNFTKDQEFPSRAPSRRNSFVAPSANSTFKEPDVFEQSLAINAPNEDTYLVDEQSEKHVDNFTHLPFHRPSLNHGERRKSYHERRKKQKHVIIYCAQRKSSFRGSYAIEY